MVRTLLILIALQSLGAPASAQTVRDYYLVGGAQDAAGRDTMTDYVDAASIVSPTPDTRRAWTWFFYAPYSTSEFAGEHGVSLREFNCAARQMRFIQSTHYTATGEVRPSSSRASPWDFVTPGTMGEFELNFVCSAPETWRPIATRLYGQTPADHAAAVFAPR